jgi:hypothetical protein
MCRAFIRPRIIMSGCARRCPLQENLHRNCPGVPSDLDSFRAAWEIPKMKTLTVDDQKRIRIPDAKPHQVFAYENSGDGRLTLTLVKAEAQEPFPPDYDFGITEEDNRELAALAKGSSLQLPE